MKQNEVSSNSEEEYDEMMDLLKMKIECICPKCRQRHIMNLYWIGRGTPRKYCPTCRSGLRIAL